MLATWPYISPEFVFWTPIVLAFVAGWIIRWAAPTGWLLLLAVVLAAIGYSMMPAHAHDHARPELNDWFKSLKSRAGTWCCDGSDGKRVDDVDWESKDGRYRVRIGGKWYDVPEGGVIDGPNKAGPAMVWPSEGYGGIEVRCFMPGAGA